ncbi:hypothetical protein OG948_21600 [Embleya sp. NBC_00888]|nr:hypothetical protein OG948_21600 [Embleya sp. NBC_00888]
MNQEHEAASTDPAEVFSGAGDLDVLRACPADHAGQFTDAGLL